MLNEDINLFGHLLDYQETDQFKAERAITEEKERAKRRPSKRESSRRYRECFRAAIRTRTAARKHSATLLLKQDGLCYWCGEIITAGDVDHINPLNNGGSTKITNLCVACEHCNSVKGSKVRYNGQQNVCSGCDKRHYRNHSVVG